MPKILIVDDDAGFLGTTSDTLAQAGYDVITASTTGDCLAKAGSDSPDLILLDVSLEGETDGLKASQELMDKGINIPVILLENVAKVATMSVPASELVEAYAEKPLDNEKLITKIKAILNR